MSGWGVPTHLFVSRRCTSIASRTQDHFQIWNILQDSDWNQTLWKVSHRHVGKMTRALELMLLRVLHISINYMFLWFFVCTFLFGRKPAGVAILECLQQDLLQSIWAVAVYLFHAFGGCHGTALRWYPLAFTDNFYLGAWGVCSSFFSVRSGFFDQKLRRVV